MRQKHAQPIYKKPKTDKLVEDQDEDFFPVGMKKAWKKLVRHQIMLIRIQNMRYFEAEMNEYVYHFCFDYSRFCSVFVSQFSINIRFLTGFDWNIYNLKYLLWAEVLYYFTRKVIYEAFRMDVWGTWLQYALFSRNIKAWIKWGVYSHSSAV